MKTQLSGPRSVRAGFILHEGRPVTKTWYRRNVGPIPRKVYVKKAEVEKERDEFKARVEFAESKAREWAEEIRKKDWVLFQAEARVAELEAKTTHPDTKRLDWIYGQIQKGFYNEATGRTELTEFSVHSVKSIGIRATIDAAMQAKEGGK
jgi:hypothetical protein